MSKMDILGIMVIVALSVYWYFTFNENRKIPMLIIGLGFGALLIASGFMPPDLKQFRNLRQELKCDPGLGAYIVKKGYELDNINRRQLRDIMVQSQCDRNVEKSKIITDIRNVIRK